MRTERDRQPVGRAAARRGQGAFTLIEVLAAVALLGLLYTALATKATQGVMSEADSLRRFQASLLADEKLAEIETLAAMDQTPELGRREEESPDGIFQVTVEVSEWSVPVPPPPADATTAPGPQPTAPSVLGEGSQDPGAVLQALVRVSWDEGAWERSIERVTFLLDQARIRALAPESPEGEGP